MDTMTKLSDALRDWLGRVEILAVGAERHRVAAARALAEGRAEDARREALALVEELPRSRAGLALWAEAAEALFLDNEATEALERLGAEIPFRADVWVRLANVSTRMGRDPRPALRRALEAAEPLEAADQARLALADIDLMGGDFARAEQWLEALSFVTRDRPEAKLRRVEVALDLSRTERARRLAQGLPEPAASDGRGWLVRARLLALDDDPRAAAAFQRAWLLGAPRAETFVQKFVARCRDAVVVDRLRQLVEGQGLAHEPAWKAAFAAAEGRERDFLRALCEEARKDGNVPSARLYLEAVLEQQDERALSDAVIRCSAVGARVEPAVEKLLGALRVAEPGLRLEQLEPLGAPVGAWAESLRRAAATELCSGGSPERWRELLAQLTRLARELGQLDILVEVEAMARDLERPLRVAVVGEFNAGKSSFINALLGESVAPVGVLPTTATLNYLMWAPDRFARVVFGRGEPERIVSTSELRGLLDSLEPQVVDHVRIGAPIQALRRVDIIDTPGFNAPSSEHANVAWRALDDAHVALWLIDATQPLKESERRWLEGVAARGLALLVLLNKVDRVEKNAGRLDPVGEALEHVKAGLATIGVEPLTAPVPFSARLALSADPGEREAARWPEVERVLDETIVMRSEHLRDRALGRRAAAVAASLERAASEQAQAEEERRLARRALRDRLAELYRDPERSAAVLGEPIIRALVDRAGELADELAPVGDVNDPAARRFTSGRVRRLVGSPVAKAVLGVLDVHEGELCDELSAVVEASVGGAFAVLGAARSSGGPKEPDQAMLGAIVAAVVEELGHVADRLARTEGELRVAGWRATARCLNEALKERIAPAGARVTVRQTETTETTEIG